ncbi:uncharacterized protein KRP23_8427 [Phytophthora ramorum]|uniref:uncharacterized protein n=1 Tax=Phytophthora ramorum TaxID=164328 RepID=UPI0030983BF8|nr:hypothetical protein KRP23_8427 [Phytophthora ramorum]
MAARGRRRRDANLGQIPLSSGEIELYSRQDEAARRRRRLLAVRDQERRLAQQVTQRYRQNLQRLQHGKSQKMHTQLNTEQRAQLTELHRRYQNSLQSMGTAQRNARAKLLELMEQAQHEQEKWNYNRQVTGKEREIEAQENREEEEAARNARRRQVEQNMQRLKLLSGQQRRQASDRARQEQELAMQRSKDREQLEQMIQRQSPEEVFVTPRPHRKDVVSYQFTRTHCVAPAVSTGKERPAVTVIKHNRKHPTARRGEDEANKYRDEVDQKRERDRLIAEEQKETAAERGKVAVDDVTSRQQGQQALEWLALVDKMERRGRGQELGGGDEYLLDVGEVDGVDDPQLMAERAFAQMLGLEEDSMELSAFSIETDDDESEGLADIDRELSDNVEPVKANAEYRVKLKAGKGSGSLDSLEEIESGRVGTKDRDGRAEAMYDNTEKPLKATSFGDDERQELKKLKKAKYIQKDSSPSKGVLMETRSGVTVGEYEDNSGKTGERPFTNGGDDALPEASAVQWNTHRYSKAAAEGRRRNSYGSIEERPEDHDVINCQLHVSLQTIKNRYSLALNRVTVLANSMNMMQAY